MEGKKIRKGEKTKHSVIEKTALLLNRQGYLTTSLAEITNVTGLQKGGLYNHFKDKEELMVESFKYCCALIDERIKLALESETTSINKLIAFVKLYCGLDFPGGCPIANAAVEASSASTSLFQHAQEAMNQLLNILEKIIITGISKKEIQPHIDPEETALFILSSAEGALLMLKLFPTNSSITVIKDQLIRYINDDLKFTDNT
ncbi:DNA-binding transcriptional regulator, AcrR family [Paenibacillus catalpae]|uniref:DNA-binding transcriptional regulator, AcrR family n=1 Tax=Paenibacillus catalpae TaxID=1045775 RepID=A0A1I1VC70_9BACL|nr:TetR/AcrR family transcriptional regulator [Paenibacillus catalpae]SFD80479.1 DNA-binding transcriptional regulator, AcrR family [Paenibacillus catalpae]